MKIPEKYRFVVELGKALHVYGAPSYKIQYYLSSVALRQGLKGSFMDFPGWVNYVFYEDEDEQTYNYIECVPPGSLDLGALSRVIEVTNKMIANEIDSVGVEKELRLILRETKKTNHVLLFFAYAMCSGMFPLLIGTNWVSFGSAFLLGGLVYFIVYLSGKSDYIETVLESLVSFVVAVVACLLTLVFPELNVGLTIISAIIVFVPGLAITIALEEMTSKNLVSGGAKLFDSVISLFKQFFGALLGLTIMSSFIDFKLLVNVSEMPSWMVFCALPMFSISLLPILKVRSKDMFLGVVTGTSGFLLTVLFSGAGVLLSTFTGTIAVVVISNFFSKLTKTPKIVFLTQGIIMLVPGSKSFMGLSSSFLNATIVDSNNIY
ncbi:threonine/serine exporter ThrE family protein, partial [Bacteroidota bacterium]